MWFANLLNNITSCLSILNAFTNEWRKEDVDETKSVDQYIHGNPHCEPKRVSSNLVDNFSAQDGDEKLGCRSQPLPLHYVGVIKQGNAYI